MKVILTEDHDTLGIKGDLVDVKPGYGQNFLIPRQLAVVATKSATKRYAEERRQSAHKVEAQREQAEKLAQRLDGTEIVIPVQTGEDNRIFGTITTQQVVDELKEQGFDIDRRKVTLSEDPRVTGVYPATVRLHQDVSAKVTVNVVANQDSL
ncbi:50S ribosomal protein L9 [Rubrivirga sp. S365]|uniref:Large ribosomal subunit protein bL9 n=1 Tax=Rubrivirga litoralis TaxID=3075598 RepID=A0ABU3BNB6_9BACT|nr:MULTISPECIES: 50S ribosomal protein L9 [unclassified Rubrivirga]MDT0630784.1 50S ribosomal protein L9 [Rubrivirga sp. F394]MDT7856454.1 50S ribosomal protein L9 [Rubrivirga sp. S365]